MNTSDSRTYEQEDDDDDEQDQDCTLSATPHPTTSALRTDDEQTDKD